MSANEKVLSLTVNGEPKKLLVKPHWMLSRVLREELHHTGTKEACGEGACGACTVLIGDKAVLSCMTLALEAEGKCVETIEGLMSGKNPHPIQEAWLEEFGAQCGFCSPGMIMSAKALLLRNPNPTVGEVREAMAGNICVCSNYEHIEAAVLSAARKMRGEGA
ncbi:MAG: (2Fe-2S)-binding protein [Deltaproteobacteria bacterium]|nr:MAG: (2Fe-2S)-binding protein [Deltaproteobacteria bacterium]